MLQETPCAMMNAVCSLYWASNIHPPVQSATRYSGCISQWAFTYLNAKAHSFLGHSSKSCTQACVALVLLASFCSREGQTEEAEWRCGAWDELSRAMDAVTRPRILQPSPCPSAALPRAITTVNHERKGDGSPRGAPSWRSPSLATE